MKAIYVRLKAMLELDENGSHLRSAGGDVRVMNGALFRYRKKSVKKNEVIRRFPT